jgi:hypothetical protein
MHSESEKEHIERKGEFENLVATDFGFSHFRVSSFPNFKFNYAFALEVWWRRIRLECARACGVLMSILFSLQLPRTALCKSESISGLCFTSSINT